MRMRAGALDVTGADRWYVTDGAHSVGPVRLDLLTRGVEAGRVPLDSFVRHEAWKVWRPLTDFTDYVEEASAPLPQFPLPDDARGAGDDACAESLRQPGVVVFRASLADFASAEGVPSRSSSDASGPMEDEATALGGAPTEALAQEELADEELAEGDLADEELAQPAPAVDLLAVDLLAGEALAAEALAAEALAAEARADGATIASGAVGRRDAFFDEMLEPEPLESPTDVSHDLLGEARGELAAQFDAARGTDRPAASEARVSSRRPDARARGTATDDISSSLEGDEGWGSARPADSADALPEDDLEGADDLSDALLLLLGGVVKRTHADVALLFRTNEAGARVVCAHGSGTVDALGSVVGLLDPAFLAAASGHLVVGEPHPGPIARATMARLGALGAPVLATLLLPISVGGRLFGFLELGKTANQTSRTFTPRQVVKAEDLVLAFARHIGDGDFEI